jgi:hypothetical protein
VLLLNFTNKRSDVGLALSITKSSDDSKSSDEYNSLYFRKVSRLSESSEIATTVVILSVVEATIFLYANKLQRWMLKRAAGMTRYETHPMTPSHRMSIILYTFGKFPDFPKVRK